MQNPLAFGTKVRRQVLVEIARPIDSTAWAVRKSDHVVIDVVGVDGYCTVTESATWICERLGITPRFDYTGGDRGWIGDNPFIYLDTARIRAAGWQPAYGIREAVESTVDYLLAHRWILGDHPVP